MFEMRQILQIFFFVTFIVILLKVASASYVVWTREKTFDNKLSMNGYNVISRSKLHCTRTCSEKSNCTSFFFAPDQVLNCQLHENVITSTVGLQSVPGSMYYILDGGTETTTTTISVPQTPTVPATTPPPFSCPLDDSIFRTVQLVDGSTFTYKVVKEFRTQADSAASCQSLGGFLARVTTKPKMDMLLDLSNCPGYFGQDYYVDGSNAEASDFLAYNAWTMSNGDPVPMTSDFWDDTCPNNPTVEHCLRMRMGAGYKWDDCNCDWTFCYICEM